jgi:hypothetical protein
MGTLTNGREEHGGDTRSQPAIYTAQQRLRIEDFGATHPERNHVSLSTKGKIQKLEPACLRICIYSTCTYTRFLLLLSLAWVCLI